MIKLGCSWSIILYIKYSGNLPFQINHLVQIPSWTYLMRDTLELSIKPLCHSSGWKECSSILLFVSNNAKYAKYFLFSLFFCLKEVLHLQASFPSSDRPPCIKTLSNLYFAGVCSSLRKFLNYIKEVINYWHLSLHHFNGSPCSNGNCDLFSVQAQEIGRMFKRSAVYVVLLCIENGFYSPQPVNTIFITIPNVLSTLQRYFQKTAGRPVY